MTQLKPERAFGSYRWLVVALLSLAMIINDADRQALGILKSTIPADVHGSNSDYANVHLLFQGAYAVCYLLWGDGSVVSARAGVLRARSAPGRSHNSRHRRRAALVISWSRGLR